MPPTSQLGEGRLWAIAQAQGTIDLPTAEGLDLCLAQSQAAARIYDHHQYDSGQPTQKKTCEQFASVTGKAIVSWEEGALLPPRHTDLDHDLRRRLFRLGSSTRLVTDFDPTYEYMSTAVNRLRIVRLALPEILRRDEEDRSSMVEPVSAIAKELGKICRPGNLQRDKSKSYWY